MFWLRLIRKVFLNAFGHIKIYRGPFWLVYDPTTYEVKGKDVREIIKRIQPGDILLRGYRHYLDGYFIPGRFSHAALYVGDGKVIHSMSKGVFREDILDFCRCDLVGIYRPEIGQEEAIKKAENMIGRPYDFGFDFKDHDSVYCTEMVAAAYSHVAEKLGIKTKIQPFLWGLYKKEIIAPDDFMHFNLKLVYMGPDWGF